MLTLSTYSVIFVGADNMNAEKKPYHHGALRATLVEIAAGIIAREGVDKVTMRTLSKQAGVSRAAPYRHFPDKTALLCAIAADGFKKLENRLKMAAKMHLKDEALSRLESMAMAYIDFAVSNPSYYRLMFGREDLMKLPTPDLRVSAKAAFRILQEVMREWQQQNNNSLKGETLPLTNVLWSTVHGLSMLLIDRQLQHGETGIHPLLSDDSILHAEDMQKLVKLTVKTIINGIKNQHSI